MRRLLLAAAVSVPIAVVAAFQINPGTVIESDNYNADAATSYVNAAQCADTDAAPLLKLEWYINRAQLAGSAHYQLYASNVQSSKDDDANYCPTQPDDAVSPPEEAGAIGSQVLYSRDLESLTVSGKTAVETLAKKSCARDGDIIYICAHLTDDESSNAIGYARGKFIVQVTAPNKPTISDVGPAGETSLYVTWTPPSSVVQVHHYRAAAMLGSEEVGSATTDGPATNTTIKNLVEGTTYSVVVYAYSFGGNESEASDPMDGTPGPVLDFWEVYKAAGGRDDGGCATGSAGPLALLGVAALLRLRRRK